MSDNAQLNSGSGGKIAATAEVSWSGDTADIQIVGPALLSGSEGAWTVSLPVAGAGAVSSAVQRFTLASDDPAVTALQLIDNAVSGSGFNISQLGGASVPIGGGVEATAVRVTLASDSTGVLSVDDNGGSLTIDGSLTNISGTISLPTGASTLAEQQSQTTLLGTIDADTSTLAGAVSGSEMQVDVVGALPAGTNAIGKLAANSGVDIGDVDVTSLIPGTGATNLGKAEDAAHASGDTGVMILGVQRANPLDGKRSGTDGDYEVLHITNQRLLVSPNIVQVIDNFSDHTSWTAFNDDAANIADETTDYVAGGSAVTFDKVNGTANTTYALINKTITSINFLNGITGAAYLQFVIYIPDTTNVTNAVIRLGTDSSNYGEWDLDTTTAANGWNTFRVPVTAMSSATGTGWSGTAVTYVAVGLKFGAETDTLAGIIADALIFNAGNVVEADITSTANIDSSNVNIQKIGNIVVARGSGNVSTGTQRVTIATDDVNNAAQTTALQLIDDAIYVDDADWTATTSKHALIGGVYTDPVTPRTVTDGDTAPIAIDVNGHQIVSQHAEANAMGDDFSNTITVPLSDQANVIFQPALGFVFDGTSWDRMRGTSADGVLVNLGSNNDVTITSGTVTTVTTLTGGGVAHDSADSGNPIKVGARAAATLSDDTMVANADRTDAVSDLDGAIIVRNQFPLGDLISERVSDTGGSSTAFTNFGATASTRSYVTAISLHNASATDGYVDFRDGTAGSVLFTVAIPAGGGAVVNGGGLPLFRTSANTALAYDVSGALTTVYISVSGFKSKV